MDIPIAYCPYGIPGDHLWVRETFGINLVGFERGQLPRTRSIDQSTAELCEIIYRADGEINKQFEPEMGTTKWIWRPSVHMLRWASRIKLEILGIRIERLQEIDERDAICEGLVKKTNDKVYAIGRFIQFWDSLYAKRGYGWKENPWVRVIEFIKI
jgi:hypothetical protein